MKITRRILQLGLMLALVFFGLNYSWTHAAIASVFNASRCPEGLEISARRAVASLYGDIRAGPVMICLTKPVAGLALTHGTTRFAPLMPAIVVLGPEGANADVAAHEYAHAELAERSSALLRSYRIPSWFDEGLAMQLDHRPDYDAAALENYLAAGLLEATTLKGLSRPSGFFQPSPQGKAHYAFARCVVGAWLDEAGGEGLLELIDAVGWRRAFPAEAFASHEKACLGGAL